MTSGDHVPGQAPAGGGRLDVTSLQALRRARDRIDRDYAEPITVAGLARAAGYSRSGNWYSFTQRTA